MTWPWLVALLLAYAVIGAVTAHLAYAQMWANLTDLEERNGGLRTLWSWISCLVISLLIGFGWLLTVPAWAIHRRAALR